MKRFRLIHLIYAVAAYVMILTACKDDVKDTLTATPTKLYFAGHGAAGQSVRVETNNKDWSVVPSSENWISVSNKREDSFTVSVTDNTTTAERTGTVTVKAGKAEEVITVTQDPGGNYTLSIDPNSITFAANETQTKNVSVTTNAGNWSFSQPTEWLSLEKQGSTLKVTPKNLNLTDKSRETTITITAGNTKETLQVTQEVSPITTLKYADGYFWGNYYGTRTANFMLDVYSEDETIGFFVDAFCTYPSNLAGFKLDAGRYVFEESGEAKTFIYGECVIDMFNNPGDYIEITGGFFDVALSGNTYTITTNFNGVYFKTKKQVNNIVLKFTGPIEFENLSNDIFFPDIEECDYAATGTPYEWGKETWEGEFLPIDADIQFFVITNFGGEDVAIFADIICGELILDPFVWYNDNYAIFLDYLILHEGRFWFLGDYDEHPVVYDKATRTLDFSRKVNVTGLGERDVYVSVAVYDRKNNFELVEILVDAYPDIKLELKTSTPAPVSKLNSKMVLKNQKSSRSHFKSSDRAIDKTITIDRSKLTKIPNAQLKVLDDKSFQRTIRKYK